MSMILYLRRASQQQLEQLRSDPPSVSEFFFAPDAHANGDLIDFDKAWQALHFTLTGAEYYTDSPLGALLYDGEKIGEDLGYGAAWIVPAAKISDFHTALSGLTDDDIRARFDPAGLVSNDIYAFEDCQNYPDEALQYTMQGVPALRAFAERCASTQSSVLAAIS